jgi:HAD superfamily hydrolase (TIGR01509 family)
MDPDLRVLLLDVGNCIAFLDMQAVADVARAEGHALEADVLQRAEGRAKRRYAEQMQRGVSHQDGWGLYFVTLFTEVGLPLETARALVAPIRRAHDALNLWRRVPADLRPALDRIRARGVRCGIVSNSEGQLPALLAHVGLTECFETIVDSHLEGVRKPDPEIFRRALARMRVTADDAIFLGDIPEVDVDGARAAGLRAVLVDPHDFYPDHPGERVPSVAAWIDRYLTER